MNAKIKNLWRSHYFNIFVFLGILLMISPVILSRNLSNLDEVWNYNFARNVADGLVPYRDFNMVQTPLLPLIAGLVLKIFGNELIVMRLLAILLISGIFFMAYKILKILKVNTLYNLSFLFIWFVLLKEHICLDYNFAILFFILLLIYLEIKYYEKTPLSLFYYFFIGLICGSCILLKQTTGILISFASVLFPILLVKNKISLKTYFQISIIKILGILVPLILLVIYLLCNNALFSFIDYTILGLKTFSNSMPYTKLISSSNIGIKLLSIGLPFFVLISGIYCIIKKQRDLYGFYLYSIASLIVIYPIADHIHFLIGITPLFILLAYLLFHFILSINGLKKINIKKQTVFIEKIKWFLYEFLKGIIIIGLIIYIITSCFLFGKYFSNSEKKHLINHYKNIPVSEQLKNKITTVDNYILSHPNFEVYILDSEAAIYMISLNRYYKDFDMFLKGNLGSKGENGQIEKIKTLKKGTKILIKNNQYSLNWQTPMEVISYIKENLNKIGEVSIFDIYEI